MRRTLFWLVGIVIVAIGIYCMPSPPVAQGAEMRRSPRSLTVRLAEVGPSGRRAPVRAPQGETIFFDAR